MRFSKLTEYLFMFARLSIFILFSNVIIASDVQKEGQKFDVDSLRQQKWIGYDLRSSVDDGDIDAAKSLLLQNPDMSSVNRSLNSSAQDGRIDFVHLLLPKADKPWESLDVALLFEHHEIAKLLLIRSLEILHGRDLVPEIEKAFLIAMNSENIELITFFLKCDLPLNIFKNVLIETSKKGDVYIIRLLLDIASKTLNSNTLISVIENVFLAAVKQGNIEIVQLFLEYDLHFNIIRKAIKESIEKSYQAVHMKLVHLLLDSKKWRGPIKFPSFDEDEYQVDASGSVLEMHSAVSAGSTDESQERFAQDVLFFAIKKGDINMLRSFITSRLIRVEIDEGLLMNAISEGNIEIIQLLIDQCSDENVRGEAFVYAINNDLSDIAKLFLKDRDYFGKLRIDTYILSDALDLLASKGDLETMDKSHLTD